MCYPNRKKDTALKPMAENTYLYCSDTLHRFKQKRTSFFLCLRWFIYNFLYLYTRHCFYSRRKKVKLTLRPIRDRHDGTALDFHRCLLPQPWFGPPAAQSLASSLLLLALAGYPYGFLRHLLPQSMRARQKYIFLIRWNPCIQLDALTDWPLTLASLLAVGCGYFLCSSSWTRP